VRLLQFSCNKILAKKCLGRDTSGENRILFWFVQKIGKIVVRLLHLSCNKILRKKCFQTSTSELKKRTIFPVVSEEDLGEIVICLSRLRCDKILAKKYFQTSTPASPGRSLRELSGRGTRRGPFFQLSPKKI